MNRTLKLVVAVAVAALSIGVFAQPGGGGGRQGGGMMMGGGRGGFGGGPASLVNRKDVQEDLKLTDEQKSKLSDLQRKQREEMQAARGNGGGAAGGGGRGGGFGQDMSDADREKMMAEMKARMEKNEKDVFAILTAEQVVRIKQIYVQLQGNRIVTDEKYQKELGFTDAQKAKVKSLQDGQREAMTAVFEKMRNGEMERDEMTALMEKNNKIMDEELGKVLTAAQKEKLKTMSGSPFKATDQPRQGGRGGGGN